MKPIFLSTGVHGKQRVGRKQLSMFGWKVRSAHEGSRDSSPREAHERLRHGATLTAALGTAADAVGAGPTGDSGLVATGSGGLCGCCSCVAAAADAAACGCRLAPTATTRTGLRRASNRNSAATSAPAKSVKNVGRTIHMYEEKERAAARLVLRRADKQGFSRYMRAHPLVLSAILVPAAAHGHDTHIIDTSHPWWIRRGPTT